MRSFNEHPNTSYEQGFTITRVPTYCSAKISKINTQGLFQQTHRGEPPLEKTQIVPAHPFPFYCWNLLNQSSRSRSFSIGCVCWTGGPNFPLISPSSSLHNITIYSPPFRRRLRIVFATLFLAWLSGTSTQPLDSLSKMRKRDP